MHKGVLIGVLLLFVLINAAVSYGVIKLTYGKTSCEEVKKCNAPPAGPPIIPPKAGVKGPVEPFDLYSPFSIKTSSGLDGDVPYSEYVIKQNIEQELLDGHKEYMKDIVSNVQSAAKFAIRDDRNDLNKTVGFRRPIYFTPVGSNSLQVPGDDNIDRELETITMQF